MRGLLALLVAGCAFDPSGVSRNDDGGAGPADAPATTPDGPLPDAFIALPDAPPPDAAVDAPIPCDPMVDQRCLDLDTVQACGPLGPIEEECAFGCLGSPGSAHCGVLTPSNGVSLAWLAGATGVLSVPATQTWVFDTDTGGIYNCNSGAFIRSTGTGLAGGIRFETVAAPGDGTAGLGVFALASLTIPSLAEVYVVGTNALVILSQGDVAIAAVVHAGGGGRACGFVAACMPSSDRRCGGPGAWDGGAANEDGFGPGGGANTPGMLGGGVDEVGGGGGGFGATGGAGGADTGGAGGMSYGEADLDPITGGSGGGGGGQSGDGSGGWGGGGGGAVQITSLTRIVITAGGAVDAGGAGGGYGSSMFNEGGGGGGSGGAILLEAPVVQLDNAILAANGGGGGAGGGTGSTPGSPGMLSANSAPGGNGVGPGGPGGALAMANGAKGQPLSGGFDGSGGGGGAVGRVRLRARPGGVLLMMPTISPAASQAFDLVQ